VVEGQEIKPEGAGVVGLIFGIVSFDTEGAAPFSEIDFEAFADGRDIGAVGLKDVAIDVGARLVVGIALQRVGGLAELEVEASAPAAAVGDVGGMIKDDVGLVEAELVAEDVVGAEEIDAADGGVEIVIVVAVESDVDGGVVEEAEEFGVFGLES